MNCKRSSYFLILFTLDNLISKSLVETKEGSPSYLLFLSLVCFIFINFFFFFTFTPVCIPTDYFYSSPLVHSMSSIKIPLKPSIHFVLRPTEFNQGVCVIMCLELFVEVVLCSLVSQLKTVILPSPRVYQ